MPILPVRYAVARQDLGHAPALAAPFGAEVNDIPLPADSAHYTLRLLRAGYLYTFDEMRREWSAYVVTAQGYLFQFDIHAKVPPEVPDKEFSQACVNKGDPNVARCITVQDAQRATQVWLGFSDVPWTAAVLSRHESIVYRRQYMQCIDLAAWRDGITQAHVADFSVLADRVAEFMADEASLQKETRDYLTHYLPYPCTVPEDLVRSKDVKQAMSALFTQLLPTAMNQQAPQGNIATAAWAFSSQGFAVRTDEAKSLLAWGAQAAQPLRPAMIGLFDPVGIAMDLNGLALQRALEWTEVPDRKWAYETGAAIEAVHKAVLNGAVESQSELQSAVGGALTLMLPATTGVQNFAGLNQRLNTLGQVSREQKLSLDQHTWSQYLEMLSPEGQEFLKAGKSDDLSNFDKTTIKPLDTAYVAWLKSARFTDTFIHNFDPHDANSGVAYQHVVCACIQDASGRNAPSAYFKQCLGNDPTMVDQVILRALIFNQSQLAEQWGEAAAETSRGTEMDWNEVGEKIYDAIKGVFVNCSMGNDIQGPLGGIAHYLYQLGGPVTSRLGEALDQVMNIAFAQLPERRLLALMMGVLHADHPNLTLVDVRGKQSPRQAAKALARAIAAVSGGGAQNLYRSTEDLIVETSQDTRYAFKGLFLIDKDRLQELAGAGNPARLEAVRPEEFEALLHDTARGLVNAEVKAGVFGAILAAATLCASYRELMKADAAEVPAASWNFGAGVAALTGGVFETAGYALEKMPWAEVFFTRVLSNIRVNVKFSAGWLIGSGKFLGVIGGVIAGGLEAYEGFEEFKDNTALGITMITLGGLEIFVPIFAATGIGLVVGLVIAVGICAVSLFKEDDVQKWLRKTKFGVGAASERFHGLLPQQAALQKLAEG